MTEAALARARRLLATPPGLPGSGRLRYGAAMTLHEAGAMSFAALEVYRTLAMLDAENPVTLLKARRLRVQPAPPDDPAADLADLATELDLCLAAVAAPGAAELRRAFANARLQTRPGQWWVPQPPALVAAQLPAALAAIGHALPTLAAALASAEDWLGWVPRAEGGEDAAFAPLLGHDAPWPCDLAEFGLVLAAPGSVQTCRIMDDVAYLIVPLTGPHGWQTASDRPMRLRPALAPITPVAGRNCMARIGSVPLLALSGRMRAAAVSPAGRS